MSKRSNEFTGFWIKAGTVGLLGGLVGGGAWGLSGGDFWAGLGWSLVISESFVLFQSALPSPRYKARQHGATFAAVAPGHAGVFAPTGPIRPRRNWFLDKLQDRKIRKRLQREQWQAEDRDTFAPARKRTLVFYAAGVQLRQPVVFNFLRLAERNQARGVGLSERYWTQRHRSDWWNPAYYDPMMILLSTAQRRSHVQLVIEQGNWRFLALNKDYTFGVIRERCDAYWIKM